MDALKLGIVACGVIFLACLGCVYAARITVEQLLLIVTTAASIFLAYKVKSGGNGEPK